MVGDTVRKNMIKMVMVAMVQMVVIGNYNMGKGNLTIIR
ncbi:hypothetical protein Goari_008978 [Gossypium aridum]|uniref:Uncharacterized protein n=1 Tax=Gossypium aridum TaxID=34290 RepID=A0A7J8XVM3_GOSAI|nr:hypothetical protein [Gossypium aridum]